MSKKSRPSILDELDLSTEGRQQTTESVEVTAITPPEKKSNGKVKTSIYLPPGIHRKLREIAFSRNCKVHDLFIEGIESVLTKHGHEGVRN